MKIIFYIDTMYRGGAQRVMSVLVNSFVAMDYDVVLINDMEVQTIRETYDIDVRVKRLYLSHENTGKPFVKNLIRIKRLRALVKQEKPDVILSFLGPVNIRMLLATSGIKIRRYVSVRNDPNKEYGTNPIKKILVNMLFSKANGVIFQTEDASKYFCDKVQHNSKIICNPVDDKFYGVDRKSKSRNLISVGRLTEQKNHRLLIEAFAEITDEFPLENLYIYGEGPLRKELEQFIKEKKLENRVFLPGECENIEDKLADAKVFVLSSDYEGMPNALMEAMAVGLPCISTDCPCGGPKELITNGKDGLLFEVRNKAELIKKIEIILSDDCFRINIGQKAKEKAALYKKNIIVNSWLEVLGADKTC